MKLVSRKVLVVGAVAAFAGSALAAPSMASAKTVKINEKVTKFYPQVGTKVSQDFNGNLGKCKMVGKLVIPVTTGKFTCKGGTFKFTNKGTLGSDGIIHGTFKVVGGTGKFKGAKGSGKYVGPLATQKFTYTGKMKVK